MAEPLPAHLEDFLGFHRPGHRQNRIVRLIISGIELPDILERNRFDLFHALAYRGPSIRMHLVAQRADQQIGIPIGLIEASFLELLYDNPFLDIQFLLIDCQIRHAIALYAERHFQGILGNQDIIISEIVIGECIVRSAHPVQFHIEILHMLGSAEHQVFEKMGEPGLLRILVLGTHIVNQVESHHRSGIILVDQNPETIVQDCFLVIYLHTSLPMSLR